MQPKSNVHKVILLMLFLSTLILYFDRVNISLLGPTLMKTFNWNDTQFGAIGSLFFVGYTITQIPGGLLADKFGGKKVLAFGNAWWSLFTILSALGTSFSLMGIFRTGMGLGEGVNFPSDSQLIAKWIPQKLRARATGFNLSAIALGPLIATPITVGILGVWGWKAVFVFFGILGFIWTIVWLKVGRDSPQQHPGVTPEELELIQTKDELIAGEEKSHPYKSRHVWGLSISYFFLLYTLYLFLSWLPTYLVQARHFSEGSLALVGTVPWAVAFITMNATGWVIDRMIKSGWHSGKARRLMIYIGLVGSAVFAVFGANAATSTSSLVLISISMGFMGMCFSPYWALPIDYAPKAPGGISGLMNTWGNLAGIAAPIVTGFLVTTTHSWNLALYISAGLAVLGAIILAVTSFESKPASIH